jgi:hypothetical protein
VHYSDVWACLLAGCSEAAEVAKHDGAFGTVESLDLLPGNDPTAPVRRDGGGGFAPGGRREAERSSVVTNVTDAQVHVRGLWLFC